MTGMGQSFEAHPLNANLRHSTHISWPILVSTLSLRSSAIIPPPFASWRISAKLCCLVAIEIGICQNFCTLHSYRNVRLGRRDVVLSTASQQELGCLDQLFPGT